MTFKKLFPSVLVALPLLATAAFSTSNGGLYAQFASAGYGGQEEACMNIGSMSINPTSRTLRGGENIDFNGRNFGKEEDVVIYRDGAQVGSAHADGGGNFTTGSLRAPNTAGTYAYSFVGGKCNTPVSATITVSESSSNGGGNNGGGNNGGGSTGTPTISPSNTTVPAGSSIDFSGRNFGNEQDIVITRNGTQVGRGHADGGGNFTTGSLSVPSTPGTYTYTFTPTSGASQTATVTVQ